MRGAIASVEIYAFSKVASAGAPARRCTLTITAPVRDEAGGWTCRVALADLHRPTTIRADDSVSALAGALAQAESWLDALRAQGMLLARDRAGESAFSLA